MWCRIRKHPILFVFFAAMLLIGVMCGIVIKKSAAIQKYYLSDCERYISRVYAGSIFGILCDRVLGGLVFILLTLPLFFSAFCLPLQAALLFYKGFVFGTVGGILFSVYRFSGFSVFLIVLLPQFLLFSVFYLVFSISAFDAGIIKRGGLLKELAAAAAFCAVCAAAELLLICLIFRPVSKIL